MKKRLCIYLCAAVLILSGCKSDYIKNEIPEDIKIIDAAEKSNYSDSYDNGGVVPENTRPVASEDPPMTSEQNPPDISNQTQETQSAPEQDNPVISFESSCAETETDIPTETSESSAQTESQATAVATETSVSESSVPVENREPVSTAETSVPESPATAESQESVTTTETYVPESPSTAESQEPAQTTVTSVPESSVPVESQEPVTTTAASTTGTSEPPETEQLPIEIPVVPEINIPANYYSALNYSDVKGVWISYIELSEMLTGKNESAFRANISAAFDNAKVMGINTVYVHVHSHSDAYYKSELFPWSKYVTGTIGADPGFDPLLIMLEEAHSRGISFQAWINPLRVCTASDIGAYSDCVIGEWNENLSGKYIVNVNGIYYLNPAYNEVLELIADCAGEIVSNYNVDGIHIDDYFYPTTDASFDSEAFNQSEYNYISEFRFANCDKLVKKLYDSVKSVNSSALFGVSCQGSIDNNYNLMYADVKKWCSQKGYLDYILPQIYYGFQNSTQPFEKCVSEWDAIASAGGVPLIVGLSASKIGAEDQWAGEGRMEWVNSSDILARQYTSAMERASFGGAVLYSYRNVFSPQESVKEKAEDEISALKELFTGTIG